MVFNILPTPKIPRNFFNWWYVTLHEWSSLLMNSFAWIIRTCGKIFVDRNLSHSRKVIFLYWIIRKIDSHFGVFQFCKCCKCCQCVNKFHFLLSQSFELFWTYSNDFHFFTLKHDRRIHTSQVMTTQGWLFSIFEYFYTFWLMWLVDCLIFFKHFSCEFKKNLLKFLPDDFFGPKSYSLKIKDKWCKTAQQVGNCSQNLTIFWWRPILKGFMIKIVLVFSALNWQHFSSNESLQRLWTWEIDFQKKTECFTISS